MENARDGDKPNDQRGVRSRSGPRTGRLQRASGARISLRRRRRAGRKFRSGTETSRDDVACCRRADAFDRPRPGGGRVLVQRRHRRPVAGRRRRCGSRRNGRGATGPDGGHLWTSGREGEGPGEFRGVRLLTGCTTAHSIVAYDYRNDRVTVLDASGAPIQNVQTMWDGVPLYEIRCAANQRFAVSNSGGDPPDSGPYRWENSIGVATASGSDFAVELLRAEIPGAERVQVVFDAGRLVSFPRTWGKDLEFAVTGEGVWLGTGDGYELELVDWSGATARRIRWSGPDQAVADEHVEAHRNQMRRQTPSRPSPIGRLGFAAGGTKRPSTCRPPFRRSPACSWRTTAPCGSNTSTALAPSVANGSSSRRRESGCALSTCRHEWSSKTPATTGFSCERPTNLAWRGSNSMRSWPLDWIIRPVNRRADRTTHATPRVGRAGPQRVRQP